MKFKVLITILIAAFCVMASMTCGLLSGYAIAEQQAQRNVSDEYIELLECAVEVDCGEKVVKTTWSNDYKLLVIHTENYTFHFKLERIAPFRYEWVYVDL